MVTSKPDLVHSFFNNYAWDFARIYDHTAYNKGFIQKWIDKLFRQTMLLRFKYTLTLSANPATKTIIDIGCGPGHYCAAFLKQGKKVVGLDLSENMLSIAQNNLRQLKLNKNCRLIKGNYLTLQMEKPFDAACLMGFFDYIKEPQKVLNKLKKDIKKEIYASFPKKYGLLALQRKLRYQLRNCPLYLYSKKDIIKLMNTVGLVDKFVIRDCKRDYIKLVSD